MFNGKRRSNNNQEPKGVAVQDSGGFNKTTQQSLIDGHI